MKKKKKFMPPPPPVEVTQWENMVNALIGSKPVPDGPVGDEGVIPPDEENPDER
jgi:hypothetical protein